MSDDLDQTLVQQATRGDGAAIETLIARHLPAVLAYVRLHADPVIRQHESCCDVAQSVCRDVLEDLGDFEYRGEAAFRNWLFTRTLRKLIRRKRFYLAQKRDVGREQPLTPMEGRAGLAGLYSSICSPSKGAIAHETAERLEQAFDQLPEDYRRVITLSRVIGMRHAETAKEMGRQEGAVRTLLTRALARLGRLMAEDEEQSQAR